MSIAKLKIKRCKLGSTVTVLCTRNFTCTIVRAKPFYVPENQCTQILNLSSPDKYTKNYELWSDDVRLLRYGARRTDGWTARWTDRRKRWHIEVGAPPKNQLAGFFMINPANINMVKVIKRNIKKRCEICSKLTLKTTRTTSLTSFCCFYCWLWTDFTPFSTVCIVDFEQVNVSWKHCF